MAALQQMLDRFRGQLGAGMPVTRPQAAAAGRFLAAFLKFLHHHHHNEDDIAIPYLKTRCQMPEKIAADHAQLEVRGHPAWAPARSPAAQQGCWEAGSASASAKPGCAEAPCAHFCACNPHPAMHGRALCSASMPCAAGERRPGCPPGRLAPANPAPISVLSAPRHVPLQDLLDRLEQQMGRLLSPDAATCVQQRPLLEAVVVSRRRAAYACRACCAGGAPSASRAAGGLAVSQPSTLPCPAPLRSAKGDPAPCLPAGANLATKVFV